MFTKILNHQLIRLIVAHLKEVLREPAILFWGIGFPILMAWGLGIAFSGKKEINREVAIIRSADFNTETSKAYQLITQSPIKEKPKSYALSLKNEKLGNVNITFKEVTLEEAHVLLKKGTVSLFLQQKNGALTYNFDPANDEGQLLYQLLKGTFNNGVGYYSAQQEQIEPLTVKGTRYIDFLVPGLLAMGIMMSCSWGISYTLIERRSKKLLRRMVATPMKKSNLLIALITSRFVMNIIEATLLFVFAYWYFDIHIQGNLVALFFLFIAGNMAFAGIAVLLSSHTANPEIGNGLINAVVTPMMILSGVFFSYQHFPEWTLPIIQHLPLTMLADAARSIFNEGAGFVEVWSQIIILATTGIITFVIGLKIFKWY